MAGGTERFYKPLNNNYELELYITQQSQDETNNRSYVKWTLRLTRRGSTKYYSSIQNPWTVVINGTRISGSDTYNFNNYTYLDLGVGYQWIDHNSDGTKSITVTASFTDVGSTNYVGDVTEAGFGNHTYVLTDIARASQPRLSSVSTVAGNSTTIYTDAASTAFTHTVSYIFGSQTGTIATSVTSSVSWTIPKTLVNEFTTDDTGYGQITVETFSGGSSIGKKSTIFFVEAPADAAPTISSAAFSERTSAVSALSLGGGRYVQGKSTLNFSTSGISLKYGATLSKVEIFVGSTLLGSSTTGSGYTTVPMPTSGVVTLITRVTDSRGLTGQTTASCTVLAYGAPTAAISVTRSNSAGAIVEDGDYARVTASGAVSSLTTSTGVQRNTIAWSIQSRPKGSTAWTTRGSAGAVTGASVSPAAQNYGTFSPSTSHEFRMLITDRLSSQGSAMETLAVASIFMHWDRDIGVGINKFRTRGALDVNGDGYMRDALVRTQGNTGSFDNMIPNGTGEARRPAGWSQGLSFSQYLAPTEIYGYFNCAKGQGTYSSPSGESDYWLVTPGAEYLFEVWMDSDVSGSMLYIELRDEHGALNGSRPVAGLPHAGNSSYVVSAQTVPTTWTKYTGVVTVASNAHLLKVDRIYYNHPNGASQNALISLAMRMTPTRPLIDMGYESIASVPSGSSINHTINFQPGLFTTPPVVNATTTVDRHEVVVTSRTTTSAVLRFTNRTALAASGEVHWIASQKM